MAIISTIAQTMERSIKTDTKLGQAVHSHLLSKGLETPLQMATVTKERQRELIALHFAEIMKTLNLDLKDDSLEGTPARVAKMYVDEVFFGLDYNNFPKCTAVKNKMQYDEMVMVDKINVQSNCEHHFVIIDGLAKVAYIPQRKVLGLSKINRIVEFFAKRPQIQERLTEQIHETLKLILETDDVAVQIKATHYCVKSRGIQDVNSITTTSKLSGKFKSLPETRNEFLNS